MFYAAGKGIDILRQYFTCKEGNSKKGPKPVVFRNASGIHILKPVTIYTFTMPYPQCEIRSHNTQYL